GFLFVAANADAIGGDDGEAFASIGRGIGVWAQFGNFGETAASDITNRALLGVIASADAEATGPGGEGRADADIVTGVSQYGQAVSLASTSLTNSGALLVVATAEGLGSGENADGTADASIEYGLYQLGSATSSEGVARVGLTNTSSGVLSIAADASATGDDDA